MRFSKGGDRCSHLRACCCLRPVCTLRDSVHPPGGPGLAGFARPGPPSGSGKAERVGAGGDGASSGMISVSPAPPKVRVYTLDETVPHPPTSPKPRARKIRTKGGPAPLLSGRVLPRLSHPALPEQPYDADAERIAERIAGRIAARLIRCARRSGCASWFAATIPRAGRLMPASV